MKLIRCYIENFGGLHQYTVDFNDGLTVIHEPNGFGKTTLAEFIRAMFYGFPRANKDISKSPRLKYLPWQGGRYGGYLIFEHNGNRYRIDRTFGEAPKGDKFKLFYEDTHKESKDFTADIGTELFGLDSESFMRSTYMPQIRDNGPLTTDNIRAKLGNLLEDTGDVGNYEKALQKLKDKRSTYERYRGTGGTIYEAQKQITSLQQQITDCTAKEPLLNAAAAELADAQREQELGEGALQRIRKQLSEATTAEAEAALSREYEKLCRDKAEAAQALEALAQRYPKGMPTHEELEAASERMDRAAALDAQLQETAVDREAAKIAADNAERFGAGVPTDADFRAQRTALDRLMTAKTELRSTALTADEVQQLEQLNKQFADGVPTDEQLTQWRGYAAELTGLWHSRGALELSTEDAARLESLDAYFANGVPKQAQLEEAEQQLTRAETIRQENMQLSAAVPTESASTEPQKKFHSLFFPALILGILAAAAGVCLLAMPDLAASVPWLFDNHTIIGGVCAVIGVAAIITAAFLQNNHSLMTKLQSTATGMTTAQRSLIYENERAALVLESTVSAFLSDYPTCPDHSLRRKLGELSTNLGLYLPLRERRESLAREAAENDDRTAELTAALRKALSPYFDTILSFDSALQTLDRRKTQYEELKRKEAAISVQAKELEEEITALEQKIMSFLLPYCGTVTGSLAQALDALRSDAGSYVTAAEHVRRRTEALRIRDEERAALQTAQDSFCAAYGLTMGMGDRQTLKSAERDAEALKRLQEGLTRADRLLTAFVAEHGHKPAAEAAPVQYDLEGLKAGEAQLIKAQNERRSHILQLEQRIRLLRGEIDRIPQWTDELARLTEQKAADTESRRLLDSTVDFLQKARESLSTSYLGGIRGHFAKYLSRLTGEQAGHIAVNTDLEVQLERAGSARALPHFSAGQTDAVHLCMRLALSDALFEDGGCFMILDDPFVNLDDRHTAQALALLEDLAKDRQILYLVCNSSRTV